MSATSVQKQWEIQAKNKLAEVGWENIKTRGQIFEGCVNTVTSYVLNILNLSTQAIQIPEYTSPICDPSQCQRFLKWIYAMKIPHPKTRPQRRYSYDDIESGLHKSYDYQKSKHFGDHLFPFLMRSAMDYASMLSQNLFYQYSNEQKQAFESILIKFYWVDVLRASIVCFRQTKPTPLICLRSIKNKTRQLNKLLKQLVTEDEMERVLQQKNISMSYSDFPTSLLLAAMVVETLANEELSAYYSIYGSASSNYNIDDNCSDNNKKQFDENNKNNDSNNYNNHSNREEFYVIDNNNSNYISMLDDCQQHSIHTNDYMPIRNNASSYLEDDRFNPIEDTSKIECQKTSQEHIELNPGETYSTSSKTIHNVDNINYDITRNDHIFTNNSNNENTQLPNSDYFCSDDMHYKYIDNDDLIFNMNEISIYNYDNFFIDDFVRQVSANDFMLPPYSNFTLNSTFFKQNNDS